MNDSTLGLERGRWLVLNQSQSPAFQNMIAALARELGPCRIVTGMPHENAAPWVEVDEAPAYDRRSPARRALSWLRFLFAVSWRLFRVRDVSLVWAATNPPFLPHVVWAASRRRRLRYALLVWDLYPDHLVQVGWLGPRNPITRAWLALNRRAFRDADVVITIGERMAGSIHAQLGSSAQTCRVEVVPNWADTLEIRPREKASNAFAREHDQVNRITVMYSGNLGRTHGLDALIDAAAQLTDMADVSFLIVGDGLGHDAIRQQIDMRKLSNVRMLPRVGWGELKYSLATADIAVVAQGIDSAHLSVPSKTYSSLAAGSAILALTVPDSDLAQLVRRHRVGLVCRGDSSAEIAKALRSLACAPDELAAYRASARRVAERYFSHDAVLNQLAAILQPLMHSE